MNEKAILRLIQQAINTYRIVKVYYKRYKSDEILSEFFMPYLIIDHAPVRIYGRNAESKYLDNFSISEIVSAEMTDQAFTVEKPIRYRSFGAQVLGLIDEVDLDEESDYEDIYYQEPCIFCGEAEEACEHLLYFYDFCDFESRGGRIDEILKFKAIVEENFGYLLQHKIKVKFEKKELPRELAEIWQSTYLESDGSVQVETYAFMDFIHFITDNIDSEETETFNCASGGGVGNDDPLQICYAKYPDRVIPLIEEKIHFYLSPFRKIIEDHKSSKAGKNKL